MDIKDLQRKIEDSLEALQTMTQIPSELQGLRLLVPQDVTPRVTIRSRREKRRLRSDASAQDFRPQECEVVLRFDPYFEGEGKEFAPGLSAQEDVRHRTEIEELVGALDRAEGLREFVGLKWFRDHFLPAEGCAWANDRGRCGRLIREATNEKLLLTSQVPNPGDPLRPTTAIRINRSHPRFRKQRAAPRQPALKSTRTQGKPLLPR